MVNMTLADEIWQSIGFGTICSCIEILLEFCVFVQHIRVVKA